MTKSEWSELVPFRLLRQQESGAKNMQILYMFRMIWFSVSRANLTVRILRYEIEKGMRASYKTIVFATFIAGVNYFHKLKDFFAMSPNT